MKWSDLARLRDLCDEERGHTKRKGNAAGGVGLEQTLNRTRNGLDERTPRDGRFFEIEKNPKIQKNSKRLE